MVFLVLSEKNMFYGLRSRWMIPLVCMLFSPSTICLTIGKESVSVIFPFIFKNSYSVPPEQYYVTKIVFSLASCLIKWSRLGWLLVLSILISFSISSFPAGWPMNSGLMTFTQRVLPSEDMARYTLAVHPYPIFASVLYVLPSISSLIISSIIEFYNSLMMHRRVAGELWWCYDQWK